MSYIPKYTKRDIRQQLKPDSDPDLSSRKNKQ